ncbi:MAG: class I tRNA ligase family protein, partial [Planctomycetota bacterium]
MGDGGPRPDEETPAEVMPESRFDPHGEENPVRARWAGLKDFRKPGCQGARDYVILLEPIDLSGPIRMGDAVGAVLADVVARAKRMQGSDVLLVTGLHHRAVSTPWALEQRLGPARPEEDSPDLAPPGADELSGWREKISAEVSDQFRALGVTHDPDRFYYTLDESTSRAVKEGFRRFYEDGLVYRQKRLEPWCPSCRSVLTRNETEVVEEEGEVHFARYPIEGEVEKYLTVAVTQLETMAGDTALVVSPDDERYLEIHGKNIMNPLTDEVIPLITDPRVDMQKGGGIRRLTPGLNR